MVGIRNNRSVQDEKLVAAIFNTTKAQGGAFSNGLSRDSSTLSSIESTSTTPEPTVQTAEGETVNDGNSDVEVIGSETISDPYANPEAVEDELVGAAIGTEEQKPKIYGAQQSNLIVDARPQINALAMQAAGMGSEHMENYPFASKIYLGIDNIHVMRDSLNRIIDTLKDSDLTSFPPNREALAKSNWIKHIGQVIEGVRIIVEKVAFHHSHVLIHCSDGWDRTSQLSALAQICLDPHYRTLDGFITLVEKDWLSFGYRFAHRAGFLSSEDWFKVENERISVGETERPGAAKVTNAAGNAIENAFLSAKGFFNKEQSKSRENLAAQAEADAMDEVPSQRGTGLFGRKAAPKAEGETKVKEVSPVFHQFLDATYQILHRHPDRFEFNERFLRRLLYHLYSCQYGTFLYNCERERKEAKVAERTASVWDYFLSRRTEFTNPNYDGGEIDDRIQGKERVLVPIREDTRWWSGVFGRTDQEMNGQSTLVSRVKEQEPDSSTTASPVSGQQ